MILLLMKLSEKILPVKHKPLLMKEVDGPTDTQVPGEAMPS